MGVGGLTNSENYVILKRSLSKAYFLRSRGFFPRRFFFIYSHFWSGKIFFLHLLVPRTFQVMNVSETLEDTFGPSAITFKLDFSEENFFEGKNQIKSFFQKKTKNPDQK